MVNDAEMGNFSAAECGKAIRGILRNVPHLIFCKLPLANFPHSAIAFRKIPAPLVPIPANGRAQNGQNLFSAVDMPTL